MAPGLYLRNSEVGQACLALECFLLRLVYSNGLVLAQDNTFYRWRHMAVDPESATREIREAVARVTDEAVRRWVFSTGLRREGWDPGDLLEALSRREKFSRELTAALGRAYDNDEHGGPFGVVGAVTAVARRRPRQVRTRLEVLGGELLR